MTFPWYTSDDAAVSGAVERVSAAWIDAPAENLEVLEMLLEIARDQVWAFAPESLDFDTLDADDNPTPVAPPNDDTVPARLVYAQLQQAQNLWNAGRVNSAGDSLGGEVFAFTPRPLDKTIRQIIRPTVGVPDVG